MTKKRKRLNTSLESSGAEFLVLGNLLVESIQAFKAYTNFPGYDLIATAPDKKRSCRIQVKSRWATDFDGGFPIKNFDCEFVVLAVLNRGYRYRKTATVKDTGRKSPVFYVFPVSVVRKAQERKSGWGKAFLRKIPRVESYLGNWKLIRAYLVR